MDIMKLLQQMIGFYEKWFKRWLWEYGNKYTDPDELVKQLNIGMKLEISLRKVLLKNSGL